MSQKIFRNTYIRSLRKDLHEGRNLEMYAGGECRPPDSATLIFPGVPSLEDLKVRLKDPEPGNFHDFENAKILFEAWQGMTPAQATDGRLWAYVCHVPFMEYLRKRRPLDSVGEAKREAYIVNHWFVDSPGPAAFKANDIYLFWWGAYITFDADRSDPYELTRELFSLLDYTRTLITGSQGRDKRFVHAVLEHVIENQALFKNSKQDKVRLIMRKMNLLAGSRVLPALTKDEIKAEIAGFGEDIARVN